MCVLMNKAGGTLGPSIFQRLGRVMWGGGEAQPPLMALKIIRPL